MPIDNLASVRPGMAATVTSPMIRGVVLPARVAALAPSFNAERSPTAPVRVEFPGRGRIDEAGAPVEVSVTVATVPNAIVIPAARSCSTPTEAATTYSSSAPTAVRIGRRLPPALRDANLIEVTTGVRAGDLVIHFWACYALS